MAVHKDLTSAECHEDKLIISATTGDAGKVVTPSSSTSGEGTLRFIDNSEITNITCDFGNMVMNNNATVQAITAATDSTFNTNTDYVATTPGLWVGEFNSDGISYVASSGELTVSKAGVYLVSGYLSAKSSVANTRIAYKIVANGTVFQPRKVQNDTPTVNAETNFSGSAYMLLAVNDTVAIFIAADKNCNMTLVDANIDVTMVRNDT